MRDAVLSAADDTFIEPQSDVNKSYIAQQQLALLENNSAESMAAAANEKLLQIARAASQNREQFRVKLPASSVSAATTSALVKRTVDEAALDEPRQDDSSSKVVSLPPGVSEVDQLSSLLNVNRLPAGFKTFIEVPENVRNSLSSSEPAKSDTKKKAKGKFTPKPPPGPPPLSM